jgi:hypothetical protein
VHFVFRHRAGLESSEGLIAPGVDIRADKGAVIWWPASGYKVLSSAPVAEWPATLDEAIAEAEERRIEAFRRRAGVSADGPEPVVITPASPFVEPIAYELNYARRALGNAYCELYMCRGGRRNEVLNALAYKMGRLIVRGWIRRDLVEESLWRACKANGLLDDPEDGPVKSRDTLARGIEAGMLKPYHDIRWKVADQERDGCNQLN